MFSARGSQIPEDIKNPVYGGTSQLRHSECALPYQHDCSMVPFLPAINFYPGWSTKQDGKSQDEQGDACGSALPLWGTDSGSVQEEKWNSDGF